MRPEGREPLPDKAGDSTLLTRSGGEKGLRGDLYAEYIMRNAGLDEAQAEIKNARRNINNLRYADDTTLMAESKELEPLDESERGE